MPRRNRVTPFGEIIATPERGTFLGNWGVLHDTEGHIWRAWQLRRWIVCVLEFRGRKRRVMTPDHYTELFFLDEATALCRVSPGALQRLPQGVAVGPSGDQRRATAQR